MFKRYVVAGLLLVVLGFSCNGIVAGQVTDPVAAGSIKDGIYKNTYFGLEITLPRGWKGIGADEVEVAKNIGAESLKGKNSDANVAIEKSMSGSKTLFLYSKEPFGAIENASIGVEVYKQPSKFVTAKMVIEATKSAYVKNPNTKVVSDVRAEVINGHTFQAIEFEVEIFNQRVPLRFYVTMAKGYSVSFSFSSPRADLFAVCEESMRSVKFTAPPTK